MIKLRGVDPSNIILAIEKIQLKIEHKKEILEIRYEDVNRSHSSMSKLLEKLEVLVLEEREYGKLLGKQSILNEIIDMIVEEE